MSLQSLYGPDPPEPDDILCQFCDEACETIYLSCEGEVLGCEQCISKVDANEWLAAEKEAKEADRGDRLYHEWRDRQCS